jgi:hypothetical protein
MRSFDSFNLPNPPGRIMAPGFTQPLTEMSIRNVPGVTALPEFEADILTAICETILKTVWDPRFLFNLWTSMTFHKESFTCLLYIQ